VQHEPLTSRFPIKAANSFENTAPISPGMFLWGFSGGGTVRVGLLRRPFIALAHREPMLGDENLGRVRGHISGPL
jgi:hypothetical protein